MSADKLTSRDFIDSNIWLYAFMEQQDRRKSALAKEVIRSHQLVISTQVINEVCLNLRRKTAITESQIQKLITHLTQSGQKYLFRE
jgi:predicted nucleic acid-binding protein